LQRPARLYDRGDIHNIMMACIILHNMIVDDEKEEAVFTHGDMPSVFTHGDMPVFASVFTHGDMPVFADLLERDARIRDRPTHKALKNDLIEHIWKKFRPR
jgi:hypothetical protein